MSEIGYRDIAVLPHRLLAKILGFIRKVACVRNSTKPQLKSTLKHNAVVA